LVLVLMVIVLGALFLLWGNKETPTDDQLRIAIFTPTTHPSLEEIERGFKETLQQSMPPACCAFITFNANGNKTLLQAQAQEIVGDQYDCIVTIGAACSQTIAELLHKKDNKTPHVFGAVDGYDFAQALQTSNESSTGVYVQVDYKKEMDILHQYKPDARNILLVYDPTQGTGLEKYKNEIAAYVQKFGATLHSVEVYQTNEIQPKVAALLPTMDVVLVLIDNTVAAGIDALITLCNRYHVTLFASDLASGKKGAALAYGISEYESGKQAAKIVNEILVDGNKPGEIPVRAVDAFRVERNKDTMKLQGLELVNTGEHRD
ncbi:MAG: ABC transporter substrate-binding protein, partial [Candidatus Babeliales bacterium]